MDTFVSIIVPIYNSQQYLSRCIDSILTQTFKYFECILIDDCSKDNSFAICEDYAKKDDRIKVLRNTENIGVSLSRKRGLLASTRNYVQYIDSDDWIEINMIEKMYQKAISENYDMVICDYFYSQNGIEQAQKQSFTSFNTIEIIKNVLSIKIKSFLFNKLVKKDLYLKALFPKYNRSEDYVISIQNIYNSEKIGYIDLPLYHYCFNTESLTNNQKLKINGRIEENKNWQILINLLKEKYTNIKIFEPELSNHINNFKLEYIKDKELRGEMELFELYPESNFICWLIKKIITNITTTGSTKVKKLGVNITEGF